MILVRKQFLKRRKTRIWFTLDNFVLFIFFLLHLSCNVNCALCYQYVHDLTMDHNALVICLHVFFVNKLSSAIRLLNHYPVKA